MAEITSCILTGCKFLSTILCTKDVNTFWLTKEPIKKETSDVQLESENGTVALTLQAYNARGSFTCIQKLWQI